MKNVVLAKSAGFCFGVSRAVNIAKDGAKEKKIATLGPIIHNQSVVDELVDMGVRIIEVPGESKGRYGILYAYKYYRGIYRVTLLWERCKRTSNSGV